MNSFFFKCWKAPQGTISHALCRPPPQQEEKYSLDHDVDGPILVGDVPGPFPVPTRRRVVADLTMIGW